jgi:8-oxo-dGTP pyrophosphatase MutT (NUDIX family)
MPNYKIYVNEKPLILTSEGDMNSAAGTGKNYLEVRYTGKVKNLFNYIDVLEKPSIYDGIIVHYSDYEGIKRQFKDLFEVIHASGGIIQNPKGEILFIFRKGHWDLPKGKIDEGETRKAAAIREVIEETGIGDLEVGKKFYKTKHLYRNGKNRRVLKITTWYTMNAPKQPLTPEKEESIEKAEWLKIADVLGRDAPTYGNIRDLLEMYTENS